MNQSGLALIAPDLVEALSNADIAAQRRAAVAAATLALQRTGQIDDPTVAAALTLPENGTASTENIAAVNQLTERLDEHAWELQEQTSSGDKSEQDYLTAFTRARAVAALGYALAPDIATAVGDALYEAHHATQDIDALRDVVRAAIAHTQS
jgi:hypothetical protein